MKTLNLINRISFTLATVLLLQSPGSDAANWPLALGGAQQDEATDIVTTASGATFVLGKFRGTAEFGEEQLNSGGLNDIFVVKLNASGEVIWARQAGGPSEDTPRSITADSADNVYIGGSFFGTADFGSNSLSASASIPNGFVAKINASGTWQWAYKVGSTNYESEVTAVKSIDGDNTVVPPVEGSLFIAGFYRVRANIGDGSNSTTLNPSGLTTANSDLFIARYEHDGDWQWAVDRGAGSTHAERVADIDIDDNGRVYVVAQTSGSSHLFSEDFNATPNNQIPAGWAADVVGSARHGAWNHAIPWNSTKELFFAGVNNNSYTPILDTSGLSRVRIYYDITEGRDSFSEDTDAGEDIIIYYRNSSGGYTQLDRHYGGGGRTNIHKSFSLTAAAVRHGGFRLRFRTINADGPGYDYWHVDNVRVTGDIIPTTFAFEISNTLNNSPTLSSPTSIGEGFDVTDVSYSPSNDHLYLSATNAIDARSFCGAANVADGAILAGYSLSGGGMSCDWVRYPDADDSLAGGIAQDHNGTIYQVGSFSGNLSLNVDRQCQGTVATESITSTVGSRDLFMVAYQSNGVACWLTGGDRYDPIDANPAILGDLETDTGIAISTDGLSTLFVLGEFESQIIVGENASAQGFGATDAFVTNWGADGRPFQIEAWPAGVALAPPPNAEVQSLTFVPDFFQGGDQIDALGQKLFYWAPPVGGADAQLIPLQPFAEVEVHWRVQGQPLESSLRVVSTGTGVWPTVACDEDDVEDCYQVHTAGAPVEINPQSGDYTLLEMAYGGGGAIVDNGLFAASNSGFSSLVYINGPTLDPLQYPSAVEIVRTVPFASAPLFVDGVSWEIGQQIDDPHHDESGRSGWVVNELAYYDGSGINAAYARNARTGQIIPVNRLNSSRPQDSGRELVVAWYRHNAKGVYWPNKPVRYSPEWPLDPDKIVIASELGSEVFGQQPLDPLLFTQMSLYVQGDREQSGFNPNDEHAIFAPSNTGTGFEAVFALRADFGSRLEGDQAASSDPYALVKYFDDANNRWAFRTFRVAATGDGYDSFHFPGTAGTTVAPPYPLSILPGCSESMAVGQAVGEQPPPPFFQDYKSQIWAKSSGSGEMLYHYPLQPGFLYDLNNDDAADDIDGDGEPDLDGTCIPWLARLPEIEGGYGNQDDPIKVAYEITWPSDIPQLVIGETLLTPKRGLPDIMNQAAVQVVYDDLFSNQAEPDPSLTLAQLFDPLNPRTVTLDSIPSAVASELQTSGMEAILGSADGHIKLPVSVRDRIQYDPLNHSLSVVGIFDESGAGEPLLLPNVLSKRDRVSLKILDGGDGSESAEFTGTCQSTGCSWDEAIEALFRLSRNPNGIVEVCSNSVINGDSGVRECLDSDPVDPDMVLVGFQDSNSDFVLEPYEGTGIKAALTAGNAQGSGLMTIAFNNDPSLTPLPVSLSIIRVDCLQSPPPPVPPEDADIYASYQGQLQIIEPDNIFDEQLVLRHSGDFGANPDALEYEWFYHPDADGTPPMPLPDPDNGQLNGWIKFSLDDPMGANEISIEGANIVTLSDNWYVARYRGLPACNNQTDWSLWAGQPGATPINQRAQLAEGWVKRVLKRLNPFEARVQDFAQAATSNFASMLVQLGERYEGDIALTNDPDYLNSIGLIEAYTTVMRRAMNLSVGATPPVNYEPANAAILLVASRLVDFYTLLGNEAYADAQDPMIGITTEGGTVTLAPTIFNFQNQLGSLLEEELVLLRGRDDRQGPVAANPVYNRLFWNFTTGDGEVAYALSYNISDQDFDGVLDEYDARILFPQGHGDAWGHYLTATDVYYDLLRHPFYGWNPRPEAVTVAGVPLQVDFLDERQFAETAAAKARVGAEVVDLTYRTNYVEDPAGQYQGYVDSDPERAWGVDDWARRAGQSAYFDWVTANAIIPDEDPNPDHVGIQRIDRANVGELDEIVAHYSNIQAQIDEADRGLNPLGLAAGVVPFDIDTFLLDRGHTHFEQVYQRAEAALNNAVEVWDFANELNQLMRKNQDSVEDLAINARGQENDFSNQLIEIFGTPYSDDIGPGGTYPASFDGPDVYHYMYIDPPALAGSKFDFTCTQVDGDGNCTGYDPSNNRIARVNEFTGTYKPVKNGIDFFNLEREKELTIPEPDSCLDNALGEGCALGNLTANGRLDVTYTTIETADLGFAFAKPNSWTGTRRTTGTLQIAYGAIMQGRIALRRALVDYDNLRQEIEAQIDTMNDTFNIKEANIDIANQERRTLQDLTISTEVFKNAAIVARRVGAFIGTTFETSKSCVPDNLIAGLAGGGDLFSTIQCGVGALGNGVQFGLDTAADVGDIVANSTDAAKEDVSQVAGIKTAINDASLDLYNLKGDLDILLRKEPGLRAEVFAKAESANQLMSDYYNALADGLRTLERLKIFRRTGAAAVQEYRYEDMAFRIFRNDALQKYRAAFDLAARYVYLAAQTYDYETNLLGSDAQAGQEFLTDIVRERSLGQILDGEAVAGSRGLADPMGRMKLNFDTLKGQMGFINPDTETNRFSLRYELMRLGDSEEDDQTWREILESKRVDDLWQNTDFVRFARSFAPEDAGPQPGLVIPFSSVVNFGLNFFGNELGAGDSSYDSSRFSTRVRGQGVWFEEYDGLPLANTPRVYLFPVGADVLRSPSPTSFETREWQILDQVIPVPFPIGAGDLERYDWLPQIDTLVGTPTEIRRYPQIRAHHYVEPFDPDELISSTRLIGRSVWNRKWLLIIPGATFLADPEEGLDTFIHGLEIPDSGGDRDGEGVSDIHILFSTYSYAGN